jgi:hypothetical protein
MTANITRDVGYYRTLLETVEEGIVDQQNLYNKVLEIQSHAKVALDHPERQAQALTSIQHIAAELLREIQGQVSDEGQDDFVKEDLSHSQP